MRKLVLFVLLLIVSLSGFATDKDGLSHNLVFYAKKTANPVLPPYTVKINNLYTEIDNISKVSDLDEIRFDVQDLMKSFIEGEWWQSDTYKSIDLFEVVINVAEEKKGTGSIDLNISISSFNSSKLHITWEITEEYYDNYSPDEASNSKDTSDSIFSKVYTVNFSKEKGFWSSKTVYLKSYKIKFSIAQGDENFNYSDLKYDRTERIIVNVSISGA